MILFMSMYIYLWYLLDNNIVADVIVCRHNLNPVKYREGAAKGRMRR